MPNGCILTHSIHDSGDACGPSQRCLQSNNQQDCCSEADFLVRIAAKPRSPYDFNSRMASPAPLRLASRISEYLRDRINPGAPPRRAARTACFTLCGVHLLFPVSVGISISIPGQINVLVPETPSNARFVSRKT